MLTHVAGNDGTVVPETVALPDCAMLDPSFVTIASFETSLPAWLFRNQLAELGFHAVVADDATVSCYWLYSNAIGGVKVQVPEAERRECELALGQASEIRFPESFDPEPDHPASTCPRCDSIEIRQTHWRKRLIFAIWLATGTVLPLYGQSLECCDCGFKQYPRLEAPKQFRIIHLLILMTLVGLTFGISIHLGFDWVALFAKPAVR